VLLLLLPGELLPGLLLLLLLLLLQGQNSLQDGC
jgi:hypothetical protein